ncbi:hypothetical protein M1446_02035 [Candidatus Dependentiae bacterium]|nr:hypothetical protein [Candidatus Dependentiae bacterium]
MKYILKTAIFLAIANTAIAGNSISLQGSIADYLTSVKTSAQNLKFGEAVSKACTASNNAFKTQALPHLIKFGNKAVETANNTFDYVRSVDFKNEAKEAYALIQTRTGKLVIAGTLAALATTYGLYKYLTSKKSDRK